MECLSRRFKVQTQKSQLIYVLLSYMQAELSDTELARCNKIHERKNTEKSTAKAPKRAVHKSPSRSTWIVQLFLFAREGKKEAI